MNRIFYPILLLALVSCGGGSKQTSTTEAAADTTAEATDTASDMATDSATVDGLTAATSKPNEVLFNGTIVLPPLKNATVALTMGGVVKHTNLLPGQFIARGAVVATLENPEFITLQQSYLESQAQVEYLQKEYERQKSLLEGQAASEKKFQQSKAEYLAMRSKMQSAAAQLSLLGVTPTTLLTKGIQQFLIVRAPISGYVSSVSMNIGKYMNTGDVLCEIVDKSSAMLRLVSYEKDIVAVKVGTRLKFRANSLGDKAYDATVISVGQSVDPSNRSSEIYARIDKMVPQFRPGMYVTARFLKDQK
jgi:cobalt-zinc-cadmium efflux system membrane fusion protein